jgi:hypothetical protein
MRNGMTQHHQSGNAWKQRSGRARDRIVGGVVGDELVGEEMNGTCKTKGRNDSFLRGPQGVFGWRACSAVKENQAYQ